MSPLSDPRNISENAALSRRNQQPLASNVGGEATCHGDDASLSAAVAACQKGDRNAYREVYDSCHQSVYRLAVRMVGPQDAADVTQQVFLQAYRSIGQFDGRARFETWLYRLAINESLQHIRRSRRSRFRSLDREPMDHSHYGDDAEHREVLERALARIDPELRAIFLLREVDEMSYRSIAESLQIPEGTVGSRLNRARRELKQHLADLGYDV
jgi:RNA polymerase sigma-70 factor (ECF subfamily)